MTRTSWSRRIVALAAAYVLALQALLLPLSLAAGGALTQVLCSGQQSVGNIQAPIGHDTGCPCAAGCGMQCAMHAAGAPPQSVLALASFGSVCLPSPPAVEQAERPTARRPQLARAPPAA